ncbi:nucleoside-diphosphate-sugar epimerase [Pseudogracilibacillus auburnensis]|uniref:Nucleoside-diphosphate-sugar epimerase n=2 Tax=Pseudogracilibacillus auburnensis TaxID=1494959 RepID=A0A2V3VZG7_9BACI|nr:nucleoside-diphosphate-sugar epimerase [Pseudogracilibacillus auburnensis]
MEMKKVIVLGATGGMGYSLVNELVERGMEVTAFARNKDKLHHFFGNNSHITIYQGDVFSTNELMNAVKGNEIIFHAINLPYASWEAKLPIMTQQIIQAAQKNSTKLAIVDNIYSYGKSPGEKVKETTEKRPHTKKGKIRLEMQKLYESSQVPYIIAHFPDFYGPYVESSLLNFTLTKMMENKKAQYVGDPRLSREHIYTPDGAKALVELALNETAYNQIWNIPAYDVITGEEIIHILQSITNNHKKVSTVTKNMVRFIGLFDRQMREFVEMMYLNEQPVVLDGEKYEKNIGILPKTPYDEGIKRTIDIMKDK